MKKIYTFSLEEPELSTGRYNHVFKVIVYLIYEKISRLEYDKEDKILVTNSKLLYNELFDKYQNKNFVYYFMSEKRNDDGRMYNPCIINDKMFGITVYEDKISDGEIALILDEVLKFVDCEYKINIDSILYESIDKDDEKHRLDVIKKKIKSNSHSYTRGRFIWPISLVKF